MSGGRGSAVENSQSERRGASHKPTPRPLNPFVNPRRSSTTGRVSGHPGHVRQGVSVKKLMFSIVVLGVAGFGLALPQASSHREAPLISGDPRADNTDVYAFVSPDRPDTVTIIAHWADRP